MPALDASETDDVKSEQNAGVQFHDCGSNFERVSCAHCLAEISLEWWGETMDDDYGVEGFALAPYELRCCQRTSSLDELRYDWPQAFGRFAITVMNPGADDVPESLLTALSASCRCDARPGASAR